MGTLLRAFTGFAIALAVLHPGAVASRFDTPKWTELRAELASQHPARQLQKLLKDVAAGPVEDGRRR